MKDCPLFSGHLNKTHQSMSLATSSYTLCPPISLHNALTCCHLRQHPHTHPVHRSLCTMHSFTCWYLRQRPHAHSVYQSLCTTHALTHLLVSPAMSSYRLCTPISLHNPCTHSPVGISGNVLIDTLYTNLSVQPMHSLTCWYLGQRPHRHSVHQSLCTTHALTHLLVSRATSS